MGTRMASSNHKFSHDLSSPCHRLGRIRDEKKYPKGADLFYPQGMQETIAGFLRQSEGVQVGTATLDEPEYGLAGETLASTDVLIWCLPEQSAARSSSRRSREASPLED